MTLPWVVYDAVFDAVFRVAGGQDGVGDCWDFAGRNVTGWVQRGGLRVIQGAGQEMRPIICWGSGQNAVVVFWVALGFHQGLAAAIGTVCEIRMFRSVAVESFHGGFA